MIGASPAAFAGAYSFASVVPDHCAWCCRPNRCPDSCAAASPVYGAYPFPRFFVNTNATFDAEFENPPTYATPPADAPSHAPSPPNTTFDATLFVSAPGSTVVTLMLNAEYFSATRLKISVIDASSPLLNVVASPSVSYAGVVPGL